MFVRNSKTTPKRYLDHVLWVQLDTLTGTDWLNTLKGNTVILLRLNTVKCTKTPDSLYLPPPPPAGTQVSCIFSCVFIIPCIPTTDTLVSRLHLVQIFVGVFYAREENLRMHAKLPVIRGSLATFKSR